MSEKQKIIDSVKNYLSKKEGNKEEYYRLLYSICNKYNYSYSESCSKIGPILSEGLENKWLKKEFVFNSNGSAIIQINIILNSEKTCSTCSKQNDITSIKCWWCENKI